MVTLLYQTEETFEPQIVPEGLAEWLGIKGSGFEEKYMGFGYSLGGNRCAYPTFTKVEEGYLLEDFIDTLGVPRGISNIEADRRVVTEDPSVKRFLNSKNKLFPTSS